MFEADPAKTMSFSVATMLLWQQRHSPQAYSAFCHMTKVYIAVNFVMNQLRRLTA